MKTVLTPKYMFAYKYAAVAHTCPTLQFKPYTGFLLEVVESTTDQLVIDETDGDMVSPIPDQTIEHVETIKQHSVGERILSDEEHVTIGEIVDTAPTTAVEFYTGVPYMDDLFGEYEGEDDEQEKNATEVPTSAKEAYILDACKLMFDTGNEQNVEVIQHTSSVLAAHLGGVYRTITTEVAPTVESLISDINTEADSIRNMSDSKELASYLDISNTAITQLNWSDMSSLGNANSIINNVKQFSGFKGDNMLSFNAVRSVMTKWPTTVESAKISNTVRDSIISRVALELDGKPIAQHDELKMLDETDNGGIEPEAIIEKSEEIASEALHSFYTSLSNTSYASESVWSDIKKKIKEVFTSTDTHAERLSKISMTKYSTVKKEDLPDNKVTLLNKKFANELYTTLNRNYMVVEKLVRQFNTITVGTTSAQSDAIIDMGNKLTRELPGYKKEDTAIYSVFSSNSTKSSVKDSEWKIGDLAIVSKLIELSKRYRYISNNLHTNEILHILEDRYDAEGNTNKDFENSAIFNCLLVIEYYVAYSGYLISNVVKTCLRVVDAYDKALESAAGTEGLLTTDSENDNLTPGEEGVIGTVHKFFVDICNGVTRSHAAFNKIDANKLTGDIELHDAIPADKAIKFFEFVKSTRFDVTAFCNELIDTIKSCTMFKDGERKVTKETNSTLNNFVNKYETMLNNAVKAADCNRSTLIGSPDKFIKNVLSVKQCKYTKRDITRLQASSAALKGVFDDLTLNKSSKTGNRTDAFFMAVLLIVTGVGAIAGVIRLLHASQLPSSEDAAKINRVVDGVKGYVRLVYKYLVKVCKQTIVGVSSLPGQESIIPYMDDLFGEHEGEDGEQEQNASEVSKATATEVYNIVATSMGYERLTKYLHHIMQNRDAGKQITVLMDMVTSYPKTLELYRTMDLGISSTDTQIIRNNVSTVMDVLSTVGVQLLTYRKHFKDNNVLILSKDLVNSDMLPVFEQQHGTMEDISRHILHRYTLLNNDTPYGGIRVAEVLSNKQTISSEHFKLCDETKRELDLREGGVNLLAYNKVLTKYLEMTPSDKLPTGMSMSNFVRENLHIVNRTSSLLKYSEYAMDDCVYKFMFDLWYRDRPVYQQMYNKFTNKYRQMYESTYDNITTQQRMQADAEVLSDIALEFIMDKFVE